MGLELDLPFFVVTNRHAKRTPVYAGPFQYTGKNLWLLPYQIRNYNLH